MKTNLPVSNKEVLVEAEMRLVSKTDLKGCITYVNQDFVQVSGYVPAELIGQSHNIIRHPDMPAAAFADLWADLKAGRPWVGVVKNRCKNGDHYWVEAHIAPIWEHEQIVGYLSVRGQASRQQIDAAEQAYQAFRENRAGGKRIHHGKVQSSGWIARLTSRLHDLPVAVRFLVPSVLALVLVMVAASLLEGRQIQSSLSERGKAALVQQVNLASALLETSFESLEREASRLLDVYSAHYPGTFTVETGEGAVPLLKYNQTLLNGRHDEEDAFAAQTHGPTATLLVRRGDEFVRVATSQKNDSGERIVNTLLDKEGPATARLLAGETYVGRTSSQGKERISALKPIKDASGRVIGAFGIGYFISQEMAIVSERLKNIKIGDQGYMYVLDAQPGKHLGDMLMHPAQQGRNALDSKDADGREFVREMLERKAGMIVYPWKNTEMGDVSLRDKIVAFETLPKWNLLVAGGTYLEEFDGVSDRLRISMTIASLLVAVVLVLVMVWVSRLVLSKRLKSTVNIFQALSAGHYGNPIDISASDEIGQVLQGLESMQTRLGFELSESKLLADRMTQIKIGLDNVSTNVRIADNDGRILYINQSLQRTFENDAEAFRAKDPTFDPCAVVGSNIGRFYDNPEAALARLRNMTTITQTQLTLGSRIYRVTTTPIVSASGERLGSVGEWLDISDQLKAEALLTTVIQRAADGDFSARLTMHSEDGFFCQMEELINQLLANGESALNELATVLKAMAAGDLTAKMSTDYKGVFGNLKNNANVTVDSLKEVILEIKEATDSINTAAHEIATGNQDLSTRTEEQASSLEETSSSMEQINAMVRQNADNALQARKLAGESNELTVRGGETVQRAVATMIDIQSSSRRIADIIGVIDGIAFQTNILALNAAVEAARAGELGRGFAVVATEVRNLAQRSATAAKEIRGLINDSVVKVDSGVSHVREAGDTMESVVAALKKLVVLVTEIADASREQSSGIEHVTRAIAQMDEVTQQNAALVEEAAAAAESLEEQARTLANNVDKFHIGQESRRTKALSAAQPRRTPFSSSPRQLSASDKAKPVPPKRSQQLLVDDEWEEF